MAVAGYMDLHAFPLSMMQLPSLEKGLAGRAGRLEALSCLMPTCGVVEFSVPAPTSQVLQTIPEIKLDMRRSGKDFWRDVPGDQARCSASKVEGGACLNLFFDARCKHIGLALPPEPPHALQATCFPLSLSSIRKPA